LFADCIDIIDYYVGALRDTAEGAGGRLQGAERVVAGAAEHDHGVSTRQLGMGDTARTVLHDQMPLEAERIAQPVDHSRRVFVS
jgi:hypothetical protein